MNNKITSERFKNFISYDFWKMILSLIAIIVALALVLQITAPRPTYAQDFTFMIDSDIIANDEGRNLLQEIDDRQVDNYGFSYDILKTTSYYLSSGEQHTSGFLMHTYKQAYNDDVFICADAIDDSLYKNYISSFYATELIKYVDDALSFANDFYKNGQLDQEKVKEYFAKERGKDSRFWGEKNYFEGVRLECLRITAIKENATKLKYVFENYDILYKFEQLKNEFEHFPELNELVEEGYYAIDFSKLNAYKRPDKNLANAFSRLKDVGEGRFENTLENVVLLVGNNKEASGDLHYEALAVINTIIQTYTTLLD